jgi:hypothetical protein
MNNTITLSRIREASARGKRMANSRWEKHRKRTREMERLANLDPLRVPGRIVQRVVVIVQESRVIEIIRRDTTSQREWSRLKRKAGL